MTVEASSSRERNFRDDLFIFLVALFSVSARFVSERVSNESLALPSSPFYLGAAKFVIWEIFRFARYRFERERKTSDSSLKGRLGSS